MVWALPISLAATFGIDVSFSSSGYLDVSVRRVPRMQLWIYCMLTEVCSAGFPHSDISGSMDICSSPKLFAAYHVFLRLLVPRHPPCALSSLTRFLCPRVRSDLSAHSVAPLVGSFFFTHLSVCLGCLSSILIFKILDLFQYAVFKVRYLPSAPIRSRSASGDGEIRTLDPLLARQVLSQLSYTPTKIWHPPALPCRLQHSTIGRLRLNRRVRDGYGCFP